MSILLNLIQTAEERTIPRENLIILAVLIVIAVVLIVVIINKRKGRE